MLLLHGLALVVVIATVSSHERDHLHKPYIVGGTEVTTIGKYPFQGSIHHQFTGDHACGSVLISAWYSVTTAFCFDDVELANYYVYYGIHDQNLRQGRPIRFGIESLVKHPDYLELEEMGFPNDIAVFRTDRAVDIAGNDYIETIDLPEADAPEFTDAECWISGWGYLDGFDFLPPDVIHEAEINVLDQAYCLTSLPQINDGHVCLASTTGNDKGACMGDTGSALTCRGEAGNWTLVGVASWYEENCQLTQPSVYTRITYFREWIRENTGV